MDELTVPAVAPHLLGGLQPGDPAVTDATGFATGWGWWPALIQARPETRLLAAESAPALLRCLCRHLGWRGNQRPVLRVESGRGETLWSDPRWVVRNLTKWDDAPGIVDDDGPNFYVVLPAHIGAELGYHEALAAAVVWFARVARANDSDGSGPDSLEGIEAHHGWPPLEVLP